MALQLRLRQPDRRQTGLARTYRQWHAAAGQSRGRAIFGRLRTLVEQKMLQADCLRAGYDATLRQFAEGQAAMTFQGTWAAAP
jgi:hypothetical protein